MCLLKCVSLLVCALCLVIPSCYGAVWTAEDEARALRQGKGRLTHTAVGGQLESQEDEPLERPQLQDRDKSRAPHQGRAPLELQLQDRDKSRLQFGGRDQFLGGRAPHQSRARAPHQGRARFNSRAQYRASQSSQTFPLRTEVQNQDGLRPHVEYRNGFTPILDARRTGGRFSQYEGRRQGESATYEGRRQGESATYEGRRQGEAATYEGRRKGESATYEGRGESATYEGRRQQDDAIQYEARFITQSEGHRQGDSAESFVPVRGDARQYEARFITQSEGRRQGDSAQSFVPVKDDARQYEDRFAETQSEGRRQGDSAQPDIFVKGDARQYEDRFAETQSEGRRQGDSAQSFVPVKDDARQYEDRFAETQSDGRRHGDSAQTDVFVKGDARQYEDRFAGTQSDGRTQVTNENVEGSEESESDDGDCISCRFIRKEKKKTEAAESGGGFIQETLKSFRGIFQSEEPAPAVELDPEPVNPKFGVRSQVPFRGVGRPNVDHRRRNFVQQQAYSSSGFRSQTSTFGEQPDSTNARYADQKDEPNEDDSVESYDNEQEYLEYRLRQLNNPSDKNEPNEVDSVESFNSEQEYLEHRLRQLKNPSDSTRLGGQPQDDSADPKISGQTPNLDAKAQPIDSASDAVEPVDSGFSKGELEYLEYRRRQLSEDLARKKAVDSGRDVEPTQNEPIQDARFRGQPNAELDARFRSLPIQNEPTQDARFRSQPIQNEPTQDVRFRGQPIQNEPTQDVRFRGQPKAELEYLEYRRTQQLYDDPAQKVHPIVNDPRLNDQSAQDVQPVVKEPAPDAKINGGNAELAYLEYRRTQQLYDEPVQDVRPIVNEPALDARVDPAQGVQPIVNEPALDARFSGQQNPGGRTVDANAQRRPAIEDYRPLQVEDPSSANTRFGGQAQDATTPEPVRVDPPFRGPGNLYDPTSANTRLDGQAQAEPARGTSPVGPLQGTAPGLGGFSRYANGRRDYSASQWQSGNQFYDFQIPQFPVSSRFGGRTPNTGRRNLDSPNDATNVDQSASSDTRFGSQFQSSTNTQYRSESNARFSGRTQDDAPAFPTSDGLGGRSRGPGSEQPAQEFPASQFESQTRHIQEYSQSSQTEHVFEGRTPQAATQLDADNFGLDNKGFQPLPSFGFQPLPSFGFEPLPPLKTEAELAFEAEQARLRAEEEARLASYLEEEARLRAEQEAQEAALRAEQEAQEARLRAEQEAQEAALRESQEAFETHIKKLKQRGCSSCHLVLTGAAIKEGNPELLDDLPVKVAKLLDVDESEQISKIKSALSGDGCVTCHLIKPPSPAPEPIVEGAAKAGLFKVPILVDVDDSGRAALPQNSGAVLNVKASSFRTSILMEKDEPFIEPQRRLKPTQVRPRERGCRSCHVVHG